MASTHSPLFSPPDSSQPTLSLPTLITTPESPTLPSSPSNGNTSGHRYNDSDLSVSSADSAPAVARQLTNSNTTQRRRTAGGGGGRARSSSIVSVQEIVESYDDTTDQGALSNFNADWVNAKGAWLIHLVLIAIGKIIVDVLPGVEQDISWTIVLQAYMLLTYLMFHYVTGIPFESNASGVYDSLTLWEQIDGGAQHTPAKKWLTCLPIFVFLLSTHYTRYLHHPRLFTLNFLSVVFLGLAPKLPILHRLRFRLFFDGTPPHLGHVGRTPSELSIAEEDKSGQTTPTGPTDLDLSTGTARGGGKAASRRREEAVVLPDERALNAATSRKTR